MTSPSWRAAARPTGESCGYATVKTDSQDDYAPGEIVTISGKGWQPGETVTLKVSEDTDSHFDWDLTAVANEQGNIVNQEFYPRQDDQFQHLGIRFYVLATGAASQALTTFTDGNIKVTSNASGITFALTWGTFSNTACSGTASSSGTDTVGFSGGSVFSKGVGNTESDQTCSRPLFPIRVGRLATGPARTLLLSLMRRPFA